MRRWKQFFVSTFLLISVLSLRAVPLSESFEENFPPAGWLTFRTGSGAGGWQRSAQRDVVWGHSAESVSEPGSSPYVWHWLVTPQFLPSAGSATLSFSLRQISLSFAGADTVSVLLSIGGTEPADFVDRIATLRTGNNGDFGTQFTPVSLNLSSYSGLPVRIAFVRSNPTFGRTVIQLDGVTGPDLVSPPAAPSQPFPPDGANSVDGMATLGWTLGSGSAYVDVYLSRNWGEVNGLVASARVLSGKRTESFRPRSNLLSNEQYYWRVVAVNDAGQTASPVWTFRTATGPLGGDYLIGGSGGDFATLGLALTALRSQGISSNTTLNLSGGTYDGPITLTAIPGASANARLTIRKAVGGDPVTLRAMSDVDTNTVTFAGASYVTIDSIHIAAEGGATRHCIALTGGSSNNIVRNGTLLGRGSTIANSDLINIAGQNDANLFENLRLVRAVEGIRLSVTGGVASGNVVRGCVIDSVRKGVVAIRQRNCRIEGNDITLNAGATDEVDGVFIGTTLPGDSVFVQGNKIRGATTSGSYAVGIRVRPDSSAAVIRISNNFIYDFRNTSSSQVRAVFVSSGVCEILSNSILVNNVSASGTTYTIGIWSTGTSGRTIIKNNILVNREATATSYNLFVSSNTAVINSDHNIFQGTGSGYRLGYYGTPLSSLAHWQSLTGQDSRSLEGDPGFVSETDLHLLPSNGLAHQNGAVILGLIGDIDGDARLIPPDRGADEYAHAAPAADFALTDFVELSGSVAAGSTIPVRVAVLNRGSAPQTEVPIRLFFEGTPSGEVIVSLPPLEVDTVAILWSVPSTLTTGMLSVRSGLLGDAIPDNDSLAVRVTIVAPPLSGTYRIGPRSGDYPDFASAITDLAERGVSGPAQFLVEPGTYSEQVTIPPIPGASALNGITFTSSDAELHPRIVSNSLPATVLLAGSKFVSFSRFDFTATLPNHTVVKLSNGACDNTFAECNLLGSTWQQGSAGGVSVEGGRNHRNEFRYLTISGATTGIKLNGTPLNPDSSNLVKHCTVSQVITGIESAFQVGGRVSDSEIAPGFPGATSACCGILINAQSVGSVFRVERNRIMNGISSGSLCGISSAPGAGLVLISNNFISRLQGTGSGVTYGILAASGTTQVYFNSLWMTDAAGSGDVFAIADTSVSGILTSLNNVVVVSESANRVWCIARIAGTLIANHNVYCYRGIPANPLFRVGRDGSTSFATLPQWQSTGRDTLSHYGDPDLVSETDLHVRSGGGLLDGRGIALSEVPVDYDGDERGNPPDIGADEYAYYVRQRDFALYWVSHYSGRFIADSSYVFAVRVTNLGQERGERVPVSLRYDGEVQATETVSLEPGQSATVTLWWMVPNLTLEYDSVLVFCALPGDEELSNDTLQVPVEIIGQPLSGTYTVGGNSPDFHQLSDAFQHLTARGVSAPVELSIRPGTYTGSVQISPIPGADSIRTITIRGDTSGGVLPLLTTAGGSAVVILDGSQYVTLEKLALVATGTCTSAVLLRNGASDNLFHANVMRGADSSQIWCVGVKVAGDGCSRNRFDSLEVSRAFTGIAFEPGSGLVQGSDNTVVNCTILRTRMGVSVSNQSGFVIEGCDIVPGYQTTLAAVCYGVYIGSLGAGGSASISGNFIHGFADRSNSISNRAAGIYSVAGGNARVRISNNFIYDFSQILRLKISAIYLSAGIHEVYYNSVLLNDVSTANEMAAVFISSGNRHTILNNLLVSREDDQASYGILQNSTDTLQIDFNDLYGPTPVFVVGKVGNVSYPSLSSWRTRGHDLHGLSADPGFVSDWDLHVNPLFNVVNGRALPLVEVPNDIDGDTRPANAPDIGADEYVTLSVLSAISNLTVHPAGDSLVLNWKASGGPVRYTVYADSISTVVPCPATWIAETSDTTIAVSLLPETSRRFFVVCATVVSQALGNHHPGENQPVKQTPARAP